MTSWTYRGKPFTEIPEGAIGFCYRITNEDGSFYIGKKSFFKKITRPPLKGRTRKRRCLVESDWKTYQGSSSISKSWCPDRITKEILYLASSKSMMAVYEVQEQLNVLHDPMCCNDVIHLRINRKHII